MGIRGTSASYYLFDGLGSVVALTDSNGAVTNSYAYDPYSVTTETKAPGTDVFNPWRYTGQYQDVSTGLYKIGARYYQPELGRWTQVDPSGQDANAYLYAAGNPVNFVDPTGLFCVTGTRSGPGGGCRGGSIDDNSENFTRFAYGLTCGISLAGAGAATIASSGLAAPAFAAAADSCVLGAGLGEASNRLP